MGAFEHVKPFFKHTFLPLCFVMVFGCIQGQDKILLQNGTEIDCVIEEVTDSLVVYTEEKKNGRIVPDFTESFRVFSVTREGREQVVYEQDTLNGNYFTVQEMRNFISGERDADQHYRRAPDIIIGAASGLAGGYVFSGNYLALTVPLFLPIASTPFRIRASRTSPAGSEMLKDDYYQLGYARVARSKRFFRILTSSLVGTAVGFGVGYLASP